MNAEAGMTVHSQRWCLIQCGERSCRQTHAKVYVQKCDLMMAFKSCSTVIWSDELWDSSKATIDWFLQRVRTACSATAVYATAMSVHLSVLCHIPVFCRDEWSYDHAVFTVREQNHSSFWRGKDRREIRRRSPLVRENVGDRSGSCRELTGPKWPDRGPKWTDTDK